MSAMKFHHIGIACQDIESFKTTLLNLFPNLLSSESVVDALQDASLCMVELEGGLKLELIEGFPVQNMLKKNITYYHICFSVGNIDEAVSTLQRKGCMLISDAKPASLFEGRRVAFLYTPLGLIELLEEED